ncbi:MAG: hypothetical protein JO107_12120 [Hyphomicrobiales bacterium]|nr:hypothetical protein [Hyphomicrobiales bacterium]MBV8663841.1 hypothetical protein [Hyphomicrobiales bacterium]
MTLLIEWHANRGSSGRCSKNRLNSDKSKEILVAYVMKGRFLFGPRTNEAIGIDDRLGRHERLQFVAKNLERRRSVAGVCDQMKPDRPDQTALDQDHVGRPIGRLVPLVVQDAGSIGFDRPFMQISVIAKAVDLEPLLLGLGAAVFHDRVRRSRGGDHSGVRQRMERIRRPRQAGRGGRKSARPLAIRPRQK